MGDFLYGRRKNFQSARAAFDIGAGARDTGQRVAIHEETHQPKTAEEDLEPQKNLL